MPLGAAVEVQTFRFFQQSCGCHASPKAGLDKHRQGSWGVWGSVAKKISSFVGEVWAVPRADGGRIQSCVRSWAAVTLEQGCNVSAQSFPASENFFAPGDPPEGKLSLRNKTSTC